MTLFAPFAEVPYYPWVFPLFWGAAAIFALAMARHLRVFASARVEGPAATECDYSLKRYFLQLFCLWR